MLKKITPDWPNIPNVTAFITTREDGYSPPPFDSFNLAYHVGDDDNAVFKNRKMLQDCLPSNHECIWLNQIHSSTVINPNETSNRNADGLITQKDNQFLCIMTADCLPILFAHKNGLEVAAIHAGWRGASNGIIENTLNQLAYPLSEYYAYLGPHICQACFVVGNDVKSIFIEKYPFSSDYFIPKSEKYIFHLSHLSVRICKNYGLNNVFMSRFCTFENNDKFFSYRREGKTGRVLSIIGITHES
jgi:YfiH family protein